MNQQTINIPYDIIHTKEIGFETWLKVKRSH